MLLRAKMEQKLSADIPRWLILAPQVQAKCRLDWLRSMKDTDSILPPTSGQGFEWNTQLLWLCGTDRPELLRDTESH